MTGPSLSFAKSNSIQRAQPNAGFSVVELLITLFVAALFLIAGYQLFSVIISDGGDARAESRAGNIAYDYMRRYSDFATNPCSTQTPLTNSAISVDGISDATVTVSITCAQADAPTLSKVQAVVTYNTPQKSVTHTTYVDKSKSSTASSSVTDGLVAWWKLNGNAQSSIGSAHGSVFGDATPATGQGGTPNGAYKFNGTGYINVQVPLPGGDTVHSISFWLNPTTISASRADPFYMGIAANNSGSGVEIYPASTYWYFYDNNTLYNSGLPLSSWTHMTLTYAGGGGTTTNKKLYINGSPVTTVSNGTTYGAALALPTNPAAGIGYDRARNSGFFQGSIDDVRVYNRVLSPTEVTTLYTEGAK